MHACEDGSEKVSRFPRAWALGITAACAVGAIMLTAVRKPDAPPQAQTPAFTIEAQGADHATIAPGPKQTGDKPMIAIVTTSEPEFAKIAGTTGGSQLTSRKASLPR